MLLVSNSLAEGKKLASKFGSEFCFVSEKAYPDSEKIIGIRDTFKKADTIYYVFNTADSFDDQLFNLLCLLDTISDKKQTNLILPYLPYLRSALSPKNEIDKLAFILKKISCQVKKIYLISPHVSIERIKNQTKVKNVFVIDIDEQIIRHIKTFKKNSVLVSPDNGFSENIKRLSLKGGFEYVVLSKKRLSPTKVIIHADKKTKDKIKLLKNRVFVVIDDIVSTGNTMVNAAQYLESNGVKSIKFMAVHNTRRNYGIKKLDVLCSNSLIYTQNKSNKSFDITDSIICLDKHPKIG